MTSITLPEGFGWVGLSVGPLAMIANMLMGGPVMGARKNLDVQYPNLYATPGFHKNADEFNRVQRGHQALFESLSTCQVMALMGGLSFPIASTVGFNLFLLGSFGYAKGYGNMKNDVKTARYKGFGFLKPVGWLVLLCASGASSTKMLGLW